MGEKHYGNIDHHNQTALAYKTGASENHPQPKGKGIGTGHRKSETLSHHGGPAHRVGGGKNPLHGGKGVFGK